MTSQLPHSSIYSNDRCVGEKVNQLKQWRSVVYQEARALRPSKWQSQRRWLTLVAGGCNAVFGARMRFLQGDCKKKNPELMGRVLKELEKVVQMVFVVVGRGGSFTAT